MGDQPARAEIGVGTAAGPSDPRQTRIPQGAISGLFRSGSWRVECNAVHWLMGEDPRETRVEVEAGGLSFSPDPVLLVNGTTPVSSQYARHDPT